MGAGLILVDPMGTKYTYAIRLNFPSTNNEAKYDALLAGLQTAERMKVQALKVMVDSKLVACQLNEKFFTSSEGMTKMTWKLKFIIVEINYSTKWMEAKPLAKTTDKEV
nr:putative reverse transcriptase domain, ribonuclease H-like domain protein [Tanacetum cinerariifolium]